MGWDDIQIKGKLMWLTPCVFTNKENPLRVERENPRKPKGNYYTKYE